MLLPGLEKLVWYILISVDFSWVNPLIAQHPICISSSDVAWSDNVSEVVVSELFQSLFCIVSPTSTHAVHILQFHAQLR